MTAQIKEFQFDDRPWRLDWLGRINFPNSSQSEPRICVYLSELKPPDRGKTLSNASLADPPNHRVAVIKVGQLPLLKIGSVWIDGILQPSIVNDQDEVELISDHTQFDLCRFDGNIEIDGESFPILPAQRFRVGLAASREVAGSWLAVAYNPTPKLRFVAIPSTVLFQHCVATSPKAIRRLVYGQLDKIVDPSCGFYTDKPDTFYINLFKDFRDSEAPMLANLRADPVARREFNRFRNTLVTESANFDRSQARSDARTHIKLGLPFSNPVAMTVRGKYLNFEVKRDSGKVNLWGFLVTDIVDLKARLVFDHLVVDRKNSSKKGANADDPNLPTAFGPSVRVPTERDEAIQPITSTEDPASNLEKLSLEACGGFEAVGLTVVTQEKDVQAYQAHSIGPIEGAEFGGTGATGDLRGTQSGIAEVDLEQRPIPALPVTLEQFLETLELLAARELHFQTLVVSGAHRKVRGHAVNYLPWSIRNVRSWHLTSDARGAAPRGYVVAELHLGGVWHYLIELERKGREALALAHIRLADGKQIEPSALQEFMRNVAKANGWNGIEDYRRWIYQPIRHTPSRGVNVFADAIVAKLPA